MDVKRAGWKVFSVHRDELSFAVPLFLLYFLSGAFYAVGQIFTETLFLKAYGAAGLSRFFIYNGIALITGGIIYNLFLLKIPLRRGYMLLITLFSALIFSSSYFARFNPAWLPFYLYLGNYLFTFFLDMHFFNYIYQFLTLRNSKRIVPFLMAGGKLGGILASLSIFSLFSQDIAHWGVALWALTGVLMIAPVAVIRRSLSGPAAGSAHELIPDMRLFEKIARRIRISYSSPIFAWSVTAVFAMSIVNQVSEYYFASIFNSAFPSKNELASFLGIYTFCADLLTLLLQLVFVSRLIDILGVKKANYVYPVSFISFMALYIFHPGIAAGILLRFFRKNLSLLFRTPVFNIIMASSPRDRMAEVKSFISGIVSPLGMIAGGGAIVLISKSLSLRSGCILAVGAGLAYAALTRLQNSAYISSLKSRLVLAPPAGDALPGLALSAGPMYEWLRADDAEIRANLPLLEAFFNENPSMDLLEKFRTRFPGLSAETRENILRLLPSGRSEYEEEFVSLALRDGEPMIRALALSLLKNCSLDRREKLLAEVPAPALAAERHAHTLLLSRGEIDTEEFIFSRLSETAAAVLDGRSAPVEFIVLIRVLPPAYYLPQLVRLARATGDLALFRELIPHSGRLTRSEARGVLYAFRDAPLDYLAHFFTMAANLREPDKAALLDYRWDISYGHMVRLFGADEKVRNILLRRLIRHSSYRKKYNYLNYLLSLYNRPDGGITGFIDYEIDTILYLKRLRDYFRQAPGSRHAGDPAYRFLLLALDDFIDLHKHLMLKALAVHTGVDVEEVYESNLFLGDRDLDNYIMEFIETSGKVSRRALTVLEGAGGAPGQAAGIAFEAVEILETLSRKMRHFVPEIRTPMDFCVRSISHDAYAESGKIPGNHKEAAMLTLVEKTVFLKESALFSGLSIREIFHIANIAREIALPGDKLIISEGDMGEELFMLIEGGVEIYTAGKKLDRLGPGSCIGELSIIDKEPRSANAKTTGPSRLLSIQRKDFLLTLRDNPAISINVMRVMAERLRKMIAAS